jgi:protein tyrosine/serine phosphatase
VECANAFNVRDLGGYRTDDGRTVRWRRIFRADGLHRTRASDGAIAELGWRTVIDLRTPAEAELGMYEDDSVVVLHLPVLDETWDARELGVVDDQVAFLVERYLEMLDRGGDALATAIAALATPERLPAVFHCSAGKDRTGVLASLVLSVLGVPDEHIAADYHLSALAMDQLVTWLVEHRPELVDSMAQQPRHFLACPPEAMLTFLDRLRSRFGSSESYLRGVGVERGTLTSLRELLLEA